MVLDKNVKVLLIEHSENRIVTQYGLFENEI